MIKTKISRFFRIRNVTDLIYMPTVITVNKFDESSAKEFKEQFQHAHDMRQPLIPVIIDSYGGQAYSLLSMIDTIKSSSLPVATIVSGKAMSCGAILFSCGTENMRYMGSHSTLMIHDVSSFASGKVKDMKVNVTEVERLNKSIYSLMARNVGKPESYFTDIIQSKGRLDWFLQPEEAKEHNLTNHIKIPDLSVKASVTMKLI